MSGPLNTLVTDFRHRQRVRHAMFAHLGIDIPEDSAKQHFEDLRAALLACNRCTCPETCQSWITQGHLGAPSFCRARTTMMRLQAASMAEPVMRTAAE